MIHNWSWYHVRQGFRLVMEAQVSTALCSVAAETV